MTSQISMSDNLDYTTVCVSSFSKSIIGRFIISFMLLHTIHWFSVLLYTTYCMEPTIGGYLKNIIHGHSPVCHGIMYIAYHGQQNIYTILGTTTIALGVNWFAFKN